MAEWTQNTRVNVLGFTLLQLVIGRSVVMPGLVNGDLATDSLCDDDQVIGSERSYPRKWCEGYICVMTPSEQEYQIYFT